MSTPKTYIYLNTGKQQKIDGVGLVRKGETIAVPFVEIKHPDLKLVETVKPVKDKKGK